MAIRCLVVLCSFFLISSAQAADWDHSHRHDVPHDHDRDRDRDYGRDRDHDRRAGKGYWGNGRHYVGISGVWGAEDFDNDFSSFGGAAIDTDVEDGFGFGLKFGHRFARHIAAEGHFEFIDEFDVSELGVDSADVETWALTANLRLYPVRGIIEPYALIGTGIMHARLEDELGQFRTERSTGFVGRFGGGVDLRMSEFVSLNLEASYLAPAGDQVEDLDYVSVGWGLQFHF